MPKITVTANTDAPEGHFGPFEAMFLTMCQQTVPEGAQLIPRDELKACFYNGRGSIAHDKCGCPGVHLLLPALEEKWYCSNCKGYTTPEIAAEVIARLREASRQRIRMTLVSLP